MWIAKILFQRRKTKTFSSSCMTIKMAVKFRAQNKIRKELLRYMQNFANNNWTRIIRCTMTSCLTRLTLHLSKWKRKLIHNNIFRIIFSRIKYKHLNPLLIHIKFMIATRKWKSLNWRKVGGAQFPTHLLSNSQKRPLIKLINRKVKNRRQIIIC